MFEDIRSPVHNVRRLQEILAFLHKRLYKPPRPVSILNDSDHLANRYKHQFQIHPRHGCRRRRRRCIHGHKLYETHTSKQNSLIDGAKTSDSVLVVSTADWAFAYRYPTTTPPLTTTDRVFRKQSCSCATGSVRGVRGAHSRDDEGCWDGERRRYGLVLGKGWLCTVQYSLKGKRAAMRHPCEPACFPSLTSLRAHRVSSAGKAVCSLAFRTSLP